MFGSFGDFANFSVFSFFFTFLWCWHWFCIFNVKTFHIWKIETCLTQQNLTQMRRQSIHQTVSCDEATSKAFQNPKFWQAETIFWARKCTILERNIFAHYLRNVTLTKSPEVLVRNEGHHRQRLWHKLFQDQSMTLWSSKTSISVCVFERWKQICSSNKTF